MRTAAKANLTTYFQNHIHSPINDGEWMLVELGVAWDVDQASDSSSSIQALSAVPGSRGRCGFALGWHGRAEQGLIVSQAASSNLALALSGLFSRATFFIKLLPQPKFHGSGRLCIVGAAISEIACTRIN